MERLKTAASWIILSIAGLFLFPAILTVAFGVALLWSLNRVFPVEKGHEGIH